MLSTIIAAAAAIADPSPIAAPRSATIARDLGGFELGMAISRARTLAALEPIGNDEFEARKDGVAYHIAVTPLGRIYRIASSQPLGRFTPDATFLGELRRRLVAKFGRPTSGTVDTFSWDLIEPVTRADGTRLPFKTNWASAVLTGTGDGASLDVTLLDFRMLWADEAKLNAEPRDRAAAGIRL